jgi:hypothetical protein
MSLPEDCFAITALSSPVVSGRDGSKDKEEGESSPERHTNSSFRPFSSVPVSVDEQKHANTIITTVAGNNFTKVFIGLFGLVIRFKGAPSSLFTRSKNTK